MPFYEYVCRECGAKTEKLQKLSDPPAVDCPNCNLPGLTKVISAAGFRLKGGGWYETDFKSGDKKNLVGDAGASGGSGGGDAAKPAAEGKPASAATPAPAAESKPATPKSTTET